MNKQSNPTGMSCGEYFAARQPGEFLDATRAPARAAGSPWPTCGDQGGRTRAGAPCGQVYINERDGRCRHHETLAGRRARLKRMRDWRDGVGRPLDPNDPRDRRRIAR